MNERRVHFVRGGPSYLPELKAYASHLAGLDWQTWVHDTEATVPADARAIWWICGRVPRDAARRWPAAFHIHEYASASVPPLAALKDRIKRWAHPLPQHRVFQNEWVRARMGFDDAVPFTLRDMGVPRSFLAYSSTERPEFDLVYLGETSRLHAFPKALAAIRSAGLSLLIIGAIDEATRRLAVGAHCTGRVDHDAVPAQLVRARAGLNLMPDRLPFAEQTSTKVLEYLALGLPVAGNDYAWYRHASLDHPGRLHAVDVVDPRAWRAAMEAIPPRKLDRSSLEGLTWESRLWRLPVWAALS